MSRILPILFNTEMTKAILDGRKTVTRRLVKPRYKNDEYGYQVCTNKSTGERWIEKTDDEGGGFDNPRYVISKYQVGDILYVRETYRECCRNYIHNPIVHSKYCYKASIDTAFYGCIEECGNICKWHPSLHMPKEAARIFLKVTDVRVERLQDITEEQARAEGCIDYHDKTGNGKFDDVLEFDLTARDAFVDLWNSTLKKDSEHTWAHNPWVWVIEFERCEKPD